MKISLPAELLICIDDDLKLVEYNVAYVRDGGEANVTEGWQSAGIFPSTHDALEEGKQWLEELKAISYKRGGRSVPRIWKKVA